MIRCKQGISIKYEAVVVFLLGEGKYLRTLSFVIYARRPLSSLVLNTLKAFLVRFKTTQT